MTGKKTKTALVLGVILVLILMLVVTLGELMSKWAQVILLAFAITVELGLLALISMDEKIEQKSGAE